MSSLRTGLLACHPHAADLDEDSKGSQVLVRVGVAVQAELGPARAHPR